MPGCVMLFTGGPLDGQSIDAEPGPLPPMYGRIWRRGQPDEVEVWYALVSLSGGSAVYNWCDWAAAISEAIMRPPTARP